MELVGPKAKLGWAFKHLKAVERKCEALLESEPFDVVSKFDLDSRSHILSFRVSEQDTFHELGLMVGDVIHNARSALDQAAWLIALRSNPVEKLWDDRVARKISFPVTSKREAFSGHKLMPFIADDAKAVLEPLQPYNGGDTPEAIKRLDELWNIDKHRVIHESLAQLDMSAVHIRPKALFAEDLFDGPEMTPYPVESVEDGTEIMAVRFRNGRGPPLTNVDVKGKPAVLVAFGSGEVALTAGAILKLLAQTALALQAIEALPDVPG